MADEPTIEGLRAQLVAAEEKVASGQARITALNAEAKGHRLNADAARTEADAALKKATETETAAAEKIAVAEKAAAATLTAAEQKAVTADLKVAAKEAGATDIADVLALVPRDKLKVVDGEVTNAAEVLAEFKKAKPHLFGGGSTSSGNVPPPPKKDGGGDVRSMSPADWQSARSAAISAR